MTSPLVSRLEQELAASRARGTFKTLRYLEGPPGGHARIEGIGDVILLSSNDYLGLANHPAVVAAAKAAIDRFGAGPASVRFICGTLTAHRDLEEGLARFNRCEAAITFSSAWAANTGLIPAITRAGDVIISDELNHASIIDGCRMVAKGVIREVYRHGDMAALAARLEEHAGAPNRVIVTDGVFSMEGDLAKLDDIVALARQRAATVVLDDSHGLGVVGATGRGTAEHYGLLGEIDIVTGTLGKALGGGTGGFVAGPRAVIETLVQLARPHLFSNAVPAAVACAAAAALDALERDPGMVAALREKAGFFRQGLRRLGIEPIDSESAIVPVIVGDTARAIALAKRLLDEGLYVTGFGHPVVPEGTARLRFQISNAHTIKDLERALAIIGRVWKTA